MAATVGKINGTLIKLSFDGTIVAFLTSNEKTNEMATRDTSNKDSGGAKEALEGQTSWGGSGSGYFAEDAAFGYEDLWDLWLARASIVVLESSAVADDVEYSGSAHITSLSRTSGLEETVTFDISYEGTGLQSKAVIV